LAAIVAGHAEACRAEAWDMTQVQMRGLGSHQAEQYETCTYRIRYPVLSVRDGKKAI